MPKTPPLQVEIVTHSARDEAVRGLLSILVVAAMVGVQWWATTPEAERAVKLRKLGVTQCREGNWHVHGVPMQWPPGRCVCSWPVVEDPEAQALADKAEGAWGGKE